MFSGSVMISETERRILDVLSKQHLVNKGELKIKMGREGDGVDLSLQRLMNMGYVEKVESLGVCYVITQGGIKFLNNGNSRF